MNAEVFDELEQNYRKFAEAHGLATQSGDYKEANRSYAKMVAVLSKIRKCGADGYSVLIRLANDENDSVACWAATHSLPIDEALALRVLDRISNKKGPIGFGAKMTIREWKSGNLVIP